MYSPKPYKESFLPEEDGHKIYYAEYGNPKGEAIVSIHGGPGSGSSPKHAARLNLEKYRVILFDQRGCGKSEFKDALNENTIQKTASDMERIREELGIDEWFVTGGSWGSTVSLFYSENHSDKVRGLMVSAIFLGDELSLEWFGGAVGASYLYTDVWEHRNAQFTAAKVAPSSAREINEKLHSLEGDEQKAFIADILNWEGNLMSSASDVKYHRAEDVDEDGVTYAKVFMHYESNGFFMDMDGEYILNNITKIKNIPMVIVHGRHDILCPFKRAWDIYKAHGNTDIVALPQSNHAFSADGEIAKRYIFENFLQKHIN